MRRTIVKVALFSLLAPLAAASLPVAGAGSAMLKADAELEPEWRLFVDGKELPVSPFVPEYDRAMFVFDGRAEICACPRRVVPPGGRIEISSCAPGGGLKTAGGKLQGVIDRPGQFIVKADGCRALALVADFADTWLDGVDKRRVLAIEPEAGDELAKIQSAIDRANAAGGGVVRLLPGLHRFAGSIVLKSAVTIYLDEGAVLKAVADPGSYVKRGRKDSLGMDFTWLVFTEPGCRNAAIRGRGVIDASGREMAGGGSLVATAVAPIGCENFEMEGVAVIDGGFWTVMPARCSGVVLANVKVLNDVARLRENDAFDICECSRVEVRDCLGISRDDSFSVKTWSGAPGGISGQWGANPRPCEDVRFENCLSWSQCAAFKVGDGCFSPNRNISFRRCQAYWAMFAIKVNHGYGKAPIEDVRFEDIGIGHVGGRPGPARWLDIAQGSEGPVRNVLVRNANIGSLDGASGKIAGKSPASLIENLVLENIIVDGRKAFDMAALKITVTNEFVKNLVVR